MVKVIYYQKTATFRDSVTVWMDLAEDVFCLL